MSVLIPSHKFAVGLFSLSHKGANAIRLASLEVATITVSIGGVEHS